MRLRGGGEAGVHFVGVGFCGGRRRGGGGGGRGAVDDGVFGGGKEVEERGEESVCCGWLAWLVFVSV